LTSESTADSASPAEPHLALVEGRVVLAAGELDAVVIGIERLDDGFARLLAAAGAPGHLCQQLERPLGGAKVGEPEADVGRDHADQRHRGKSCPLAIICVPTSTSISPSRNRFNSVDSEPFRRIASRSRARDAGPRARPRHFGLDALGAEAGLLEIRPAQQRHSDRHARRVVAVVAARAPGVALAVN
jgi:hypothetical protein